MFFLFFSIRNAFRKKAVAILAILGVAFGCALMTFLFSVTRGMEKRVEQTMNEFSGRLLVVGRDALFGGLLLGMGTSPFPVTYADTVRGIPHVKEATGQVSALLRPEGMTFVTPLFGYGGAGSPVPPTWSPPGKIIAGAAPADDKEIIIGKRLREYMVFFNINYAVGDVYHFLVLEGDARSVRRLDLKVVGVYQTGNEVLDGAFSGTEKLTREIARIPAGKISALNVQVDHLENVEGVAQAINRELTGKIPEVQVAAPRELLIPFQNILRTLRNFVLLISIVAVVAGSLSILVVMLLSIMERQREFGILKALGWTPANIAVMILAESISLSLIGAGLGIGLGFAGLAIAWRFAAVEVGFLSWPVVLAVGACGVLVGALGGLYPAWRANRAAPAQILRSA
jgi:putative ABC transport system permease protein